MAYRVKLQNFEGPLDLLLFLIKKNEVDIYDIPIAEITSQYLEYIEIIKLLDLESASEFILLAATLIRIKAKMLLPRPQIDEDEDIIVDEGTIVFLNGSSSYDNRGIENFTWSFEFNRSIVELYGDKAAFNFTVPGTFTITLTVKDRANNSDTDEIIVTVLEVIEKDVTPPFPPDNGGDEKRNQCCHQTNKNPNQDGPPVTIPCLFACSKGREV